MRSAADCTARCATCRSAIGKPRIRLDNRRGRVSAVPPSTLSRHSGHFGCPTADGPVLAVRDQLKTFGVVDGSDGYCWNPSFGSLKPAARQWAPISVVLRPCTSSHKTDIPYLVGVSAARPRSVRKGLTRGVTLRPSTCARPSTASTRRPIALATRHDTLASGELPSQFGIVSVRPWASWCGLGLRHANALRPRTLRRDLRSGRWRARYRSGNGPVRRRPCARRPVWPRRSGSCVRCS